MLLCIHLQNAYSLLVVIDAVMPSDDDVMKNSSFTFQKNMSGWKNATVPGIKIPTHTVYKLFTKKG